MASTEALRLADLLEKAPAHTLEDGTITLYLGGTVVADKAAAELRRLSAVEAELLAMRRVFSEAGCTFDVNYIRRLVRAEAQRDALLEAAAIVGTQEDTWKGYGGQWAPPGPPIKTVHMLRELPEGTLLYAAIKAVEGEQK